MFRAVLLIWLSVSFLHAAALDYSDQPDARFPIVREEKSPHGDIIIEQRNSGQGGGQFWLSETKHRSHRIMLFVYTRGADVIMSPDEAWVAVNDRSASGLAEIHLYKRKHGVEYVEDMKSDINAKAWSAAKRQTNLDLDKTDHRYTAARRWLNGSRNLEIGLNAEGNKIYLEKWRGIYDIKTGKVRAVSYKDAGVFRN